MINKDADLGDENVIDRSIYRVRLTDVETHTDMEQLEHGKWITDDGNGFEHRRRIK